MKKILFILLIVVLELVILTKKVDDVFIEKINLKLKPNELAITFLLFKDNKALLLNTPNQNLLIAIDIKNNQQLINDLEHFNSGKLDYLLGFKDYDIVSDNKIIIKNNLKIDNFTINENNYNLKLNYLDHNFCFYFNNYDNYFNDCHYVYLNKVNDEVEFSVEPELILYNELNEKFSEKMYDKWIDTFYLDGESYNVVKLNQESYNIINIPIKN